MSAILRFDYRDIRCQHAVGLGCRELASRANSILDSGLLVLWPEYRRGTLKKNFFRPIGSLGDSGWVVPDGGS